MKFNVGKNVVIEKSRVVKTIDKVSSRRCKITILNLFRYEHNLKQNWIRETYRFGISFTFQPNSFEFQFHFCWEKEVCSAFFIHHLFCDEHKYFLNIKMSCKIKWRLCIDPKDKFSGLQLGREIKKEENEDLSFASSLAWKKLTSKIGVNGYENTILICANKEKWLYFLLSSQTPPISFLHSKVMWNWIFMTFALYL